MTTSFQQPELGALYERLLIPGGRVVGDMVAEHHVVIRETKAVWRKISEYVMGGDPLLLWKIADPKFVDEGTDVPLEVEYHFLWRGEKVYASLGKDEDFFKWFGPWKNR